ncbi:MAG: type II toxin-antitoxin system RatA family toxin [Pseudomonadota bacterium]|nr:type II toxin-antitoxin system RatA family toxin [Alphaproteobacteria bacterium]MDP5012145.1 type II toxin-antitoxin system RatA family toxin [Alphaproteobacteria bacterium]MDP5370113.1 type II toxin-antitoxin system RatA family toxin [Pseudomonadota bacterium]
MPTHSEKRIVPYSPAQMYSLVADVSSYPDFLPWVNSACLYNQTENGFEADLSIGATFMNHAYSSKVVLQPDLYRIDVTHTKGPFHHLNNHWIFCECNDGTEIEFFLDFELSNPFLKPVLQPFLNQAASMMVSAFETRAKQLFG